MIVYRPSVYVKMHLLTFDLVHLQRKVKSSGTAPDIDGYGPLIFNDSYGAFH